MTLDELTVAERSLAEQALARLGEEERQVLCLRYGLVGHVPREQDDVAVKLGWRPDAVATVEAQALSRLLGALPPPVAVKLGLLAPELLTAFAPTARHRLSPLAE